MIGEPRTLTALLVLAAVLWGPWIGFGAARAEDRCGCGCVEMPCCCRVKPPSDLPRAGGGKAPDRCCIGKDRAPDPAAELLARELAFRPAVLSSSELPAIDPGAWKARPCSAPLVVAPTLLPEIPPPR